MTSDEPLRWTSLFMAGLRAGVPWGSLVRMGLQQLVAMLEAAAPRGPDRDASGEAVRDATQEDIRRFFG